MLTVRQPTPFCRSSLCRRHFRISTRCPLFPAAPHSCPGIRETYGRRITILAPAPVMNRAVSALDLARGHRHPRRRGVRVRLNELDPGPHDGREHDDRRQPAHLRHDVAHARSVPDDVTVPGPARGAAGCATGRNDDHRRPRQDGGYEPASLLRGTRRCPPRLHSRRLRTVRAGPPRPSARSAAGRAPRPSTCAPGSPRQAARTSLPS